jgi:hypothetical protein
LEGDHIKLHVTSVLRLVKKKVKFALEQAIKDSEGEWMYSSTLSLTSALDGSRW